MVTEGEKVAKRMNEDRVFDQMKAMKDIVKFMQEELIISKLRATRLKKDIRKWWFTKTSQMDMHRERVKQLEDCANKVVRIKDLKSHFKSSLKEGKNA